MISNDKRAPLSFPLELMSEGVIVMSQTTRGVYVIRSNLRGTELMQGDIWVISNPEGFDQSMVLVLRFRVRPPIVTGISEHGESSDHVYSNSLFRGLKVLLADADYVNRAVTQRLLEKLGCIVSSVSSGYECLSALGPAVSSCQIVLLDLHLPDLDGFEVTMRIRKFRSRSWPLIIALTAYDDADTTDRCMQIGMNGVIQKPGTFQEITDGLKRILMQANRIWLDGSSASPWSSISEILERRNAPA